MSNVIDNDKQVAKELTLAVAAKMTTTISGGQMDYTNFAKNVAIVYGIIYAEVKKG